MTNADKIRSMTDEQLADWIGSIIDIESCKYCAYDYDSCIYKQCPEGRLAWLRKEAKDDD